MNYVLLIVAILGAILTISSSQAYSQLDISNTNQTKIQENTTMGLSFLPGYTIKQSASVSVGPMSSSAPIQIYCDISDPGRDIYNLVMGGGFQGSPKLYATTSKPIETSTGNQLGWEVIIYNPDAAASGTATAFVACGYFGR